MMQDGTALVHQVGSIVIRSMNVVYCTGGLIGTNRNRNLTKALSDIIEITRN